MTSPAFTNASLRGTYAVTVTGEGGRAPFAGLGLLTFDGSGAVSGSLVESRPRETFAERAVAATPYSAAYALSDSGTGTLRTDDVVGGGEAADAWLAVRAVTLTSAAPIAEEIALIFRNPEPVTGGLRTATARRLPDGALFSNASLRGRYTGFAMGRGGTTPLAGFGVILYDGAGGFTETNVANTPGETIRERRFIAGSDQGHYLVNTDGTGTVADGNVLFVVTRATAREGEPALAEEYGFMLRNLVPTNGAHFTGVVRRITD